jgi:hypothetical protein
MARFVARLWPPALGKRNRQGDLPAHIAAKGQSMHMLRFVAREWPQGLLEPNKAGRLPIHLAIRSFDKSSEKVQFLAEECPPSLQVRAGEYGQHPLHAALGWELSFDLVQILVNGWPEALLERDGLGRLPLQVAAAPHLAQLDTIYFLLRTCPQVLR